MDTSTEYYYLDGNAVTYLWDCYVAYRQEGSSSEDDLTLSPFHKSVISEYVLDELITIPINNVYKKHLVFLSIFQNHPIFTSIAKPTKEQLDAATASDLLLPSTFLNDVVAHRTLAMIFPAQQADLEQDIRNKEDGRQAAERLVTRDIEGRPVYVNLQDRLTVADTITKILDEQSLRPMNSNHDFHLLCMYLYAATRNRLINVPAGMRKGPNQMLNHQIDFYHLSYLPFVKGFVSNDTFLTLVAQEVVRYFNIGTEILTKEQFWTTWLRELLSGRTR